jgi:hypothetical protein
MALLAEGIWPCTLISAAFGEDDRGSPKVQINVRITDGPSKGRPCTYEDQVNAKSALYIARSCKAVGWKGHDLQTLHDDAAAWAKESGGETTVEIRHIPLMKGKKYDAWVDAGQKGDPPIWDKPNSIGRGSRVLAPVSSERLLDANDAMRAAMAADAGGGAPDDAQPDDGIPFISSAFSHDVCPIAKVLR